MAGTNRGFNISLDRSGKAARRWESMRNKVMRDSGQSRGLTGAALEAAVMGIALADPSLVKIEQAGAT